MRVVVYVNKKLLYNSLSHIDFTPQYMQYAICNMHKNDHSMIEL